MQLQTSKKEKKDRPVNIRFTRTEFETLKTIGQIEDRDLSYVVSFFVHLGMNLYNRSGSLAELRDLRTYRFGHQHPASAREGSNGRLKAMFVKR